MDAADIARYDAARDLTGKPFRSACYAPFTHMVFDTLGRVRACCVNSEYILGDLRQQRLRDIWSGERYQRLREALQAYRFNLGCRECYDKIGVGLDPQATITDTQLIALKFEHFTVEPEAPFRPKHFEFHLSNKCNLECVMCTGIFSSLIRAKREQLPPVPPAYGDQFFEDLQEYLPSLETAQFLGGEPFLIPEMYRIWDLLIEGGYQPHCHVTTNGTVFSPRIEDIMQRLPVSINLSMDGVTAETFEAIRKNASFERVVKNLRKFREICQARGTAMGINLSLSRLNQHEFCDFLLFAEDEGISVSVSNVYAPDELSLFSLPAAEIEAIADAWQEQFARHAGRLTANGRLLEFCIRDLRHHSARRRASLAHNFPAQRSEHQSSLEPAQARERLARWAPQAPIEEILVDPHDQITTQQCVAGGVWPEPPELVGSSFADFSLSVLNAHSRNIETLDLDHQGGVIDRTVKFNLPGGRIRLARTISLAEYDAAGHYSGARVLLCFQPVVEFSATAHSSGG